MTRPFRSALLLGFAAALAGAGPAAAAEKDAPPPTVGEKTADLDRRDGLFPLFVDAERGAGYLLLPPPSGERGLVAEFLYVHGLVQGLGSNPVGLDRGQVSGGDVVRVRRLGARVLFEQVNLGFRALSDDADERRATEESFATSVLWGGEIAALDPDGSALVDLTGFVVRDAHGIAAQLKRAGQGGWKLDADRSALEPAACLAFPDNLEFEATLTFASDEPGGHVRSVTPTPEAVTLTVHHSFVRLPDDGYRPREFDPRMGLFGIAFADYAAPLDGPLTRRWIVRHRLEHTDPADPASPVRDPIVFYVDRGAPEPVRSALVEGAGWWASAFAAAGFPDGYRVELLPEGVHPLDVRYNVITWVHRSTRGWSYGGGVIDPRTGEMIKAHVNLGSLRVRQDRRIFEGLAGADRTGTGAPDDPVELALARIRQLAAHEVGHSLGLAHNFAASTYDDRASVMDYPAPLVDIAADGSLDFSRAYGTGVGSWDSLCIRYAYTAFPGGDEAAGLAALVREALDDHVYVADPDARPLRSADPRGNLWDNGPDAVAGLEHALRVRRIALDRFGEHNVRPGRPLAELEEVLATVYFHHRYQLEAAVKTVGGFTYAYALSGDGQTPVRPLPPAEQRRGLEAVLRLLDPAELDVPESVLAAIPPRPPGWERNPEQFASEVRPAFDAVGAAATAAGQAVSLLLMPERLGRVYDFHRRDPEQLSLHDLLHGLLTAAFAAPKSVPERVSGLRATVRRVVVNRMIAVALVPDLRPELRAAIEVELRRARDLLDRDDDAMSVALRHDVRRYLDRGATGQPEPVPERDLPPGSPIGAAWQGCGSGP